MREGDTLAPHQQEFHMGKFSRYLKNGLCSFEIGRMPTPHKEGNRLACEAELPLQVIPVGRRDEPNGFNIHPVRRKNDTIRFNIVESK